MYEYKNAAEESLENLRKIADMNGGEGQKDLIRANQFCANMNMDIWLKNSFTETLEELEECKRKYEEIKERAEKDGRIDIVDKMVQMIARVKDEIESTKEDISFIEAKIAKNKSENADLMKRISVSKIGVLTINAPTAAKAEAAVKEEKVGRDNIKKGEEVGDDN